MAEINTLAEPTQNAKVSFLSEQVVKLKENMLSRTPSLKSGVENFEGGN